MKDEQLVRALIQTLKNAGTTPNGQLAHGTGGLFAGSRADPVVMNAIPVPQLGLAARLKARATRFTDPTFAILTAQAANSGTHPTGKCDPGKVSGNLTEQEVTFPFGNHTFSTKTFSVADVGSLVNRGEFEDFRLMGGTLAGIDSVTPTINPRDVLNREFQLEMWKTKFGWAKEFGRETFIGNPANNSGEHREAKGLDILINTGWVDINAVALPAGSQPIVRPAITANLDTQAGTAGPLAVAEFHAVVRALHLRAKRTGLTPLDIKIVMADNLFYALTAIWPCNYQTSRCIGSSANNQTVFVDAEAQRKLTQDMRDNNYLLIDGKEYEVVLDDGVTETEGAGVDPDVGAGTYISPVYFVPMTAGGEQIVFSEYFQFNNAVALEFINMMGRQNKFNFTDNGRFLWIYRENAACLSADMKERCRIVTRAPWLSARITSFRYKPTLIVPTGF